MTLNELPAGKKGIIKKLNLDGITRRRLQDLGFIPNTEIECLLKTPSNGPISYRLRDSTYALREEDAEQIDIKIGD